jgi:FkbM family methyltransferase
LRLGGGRNLRTLVGALVQTRHYVAAANMFRVYARPGDAVRRYLFRRGEYPTTLRLRTPLGALDLTIYSHHDVLTVNEIVCRKDYPADEHDRVVVDFGSNIGISAAWFLTRGREAFTYLFEPLPANLARLRRNLAPFEGRFAVAELAVGLETATVDFGFEDSGRYGGVGAHTGRSMRVECRDSNEVLTSVLERHHRIDILKIDIETMERELVARIPAGARERIEKIYAECRFSSNPLRDTHSYRQYGSIAQFRRR